MFGKSKKNKEKQQEQNSNENPNTPVEVDKGAELTDNEFYNQIKKEKQQIFGKKPETVTKKELYEALEKYYNNKRESDDNPFRTREDIHITFFNSDMTIARDNVPFEEIKLAGRSVLINKRFENGRIIIEEMYPYPQLEINLEEEYANKENTKKQLHKINKYLLYVKNKIAEGDERYKLIDIEDMKEEKIRLEKILQSIKYGKSAMFVLQHPHSKRKTLMMKKRNGEYHFLKTTEDGFVVEENNVRSIKGNKIITDVENITNKRKNLNFKGILFSIAIILGVALFMFGLFELLTFNEQLFDKRVDKAVDQRTKGYQEHIDYLENKLKQQGIQPKDINEPSGTGSKQSYEVPK